MNKNYNQIIKKSIISICLGIAILILNCYHNSDNAKVTIQFKENFILGDGNDQGDGGGTVGGGDTGGDSGTGDPENPDPPDYVGWNSGVNRLTLTVSGPNIEEDIYKYPEDGESFQKSFGYHAFSVTLPAGENVTFTVLAYNNGSNSPNWGGSATVSLKPGNQNIVITMIAMTKMASHGSAHRVFFEQIPSDYCKGYKIYRSTDPDKNYKYIGDDVTLVNVSTIVNGVDMLGNMLYRDDEELVPNTYYYKISVVNRDGVEGLLCDKDQRTISQ